MMSDKELCTACNHTKPHDGGGIGICRYKECGCDGPPGSAVLDTSPKPLFVRDAIDLLSRTSIGLDDNLIKSTLRLDPNLSLDTLERWISIGKKWETVHGSVGKFKSDDSTSEAYEHGQMVLHRWLGEKD